MFHKKDVYKYTNIIFWKHNPIHRSNAISLFPSALLLCTLLNDLPTPIRIFYFYFLIKEIG